MTQTQTLQARFDAALRLPTPAVRYELTRQVSERYAGQHVMAVAYWLAELEAFASSGACTIERLPTLVAERVASWEPRRGALEYVDFVSQQRVRWREQSLEIITAEWAVDSSNASRTFVVGASRELVEAFYTEYTHWTLGTRDEVMVFDHGEWSRDQSLFASIQSSSLEQLVLAESLRTQLVTDLERFFASRELYRELDVPWKRGALFIGPPGNGKTLTIRALAKHLKVPVFYVKSFAGHHNPHHGIGAVFQRARQSPGCMMVLEDLDTLISEYNRSFFLNELDGFALNDGLCIIATTNHPEALDAAIIDRPSRFDRKYHFTLPAKLERHRMINRWFANRVERARPTESTIAQVAADTEGFSFAYLKELCVSAAMEWVASGGRMDDALVTQCKLLRSQMNSKRIAGLVAPIGPRG